MKKSSFEEYSIHNLWGHQDVEWVAQDASGLSGGMLIIWNSATFKFLNSFSGYGFLGIKVEMEGVLLYIVNIYSPCQIAGKIRLWEELLSFKQQSVEGEWCVGGDFNAVMLASERHGSSAVGRQKERILFNRFMEDMEVIDVSVLGKKFSLFSGDGKSMSRIDRFLLSEGFINSQGISGQWIGDRDISDHCPIWFIDSSNNWGPKPFRFINGWLEHPEFFPFVE
jgi:exonuclease III